MNHKCTQLDSWESITAMTITTILAQESFEISLLHFSLYFFSDWSKKGSSLQRVFIYIYLFYIFILYILYIYSSISSIIARKAHAFKEYSSIYNIYFIYFIYLFIYFEYFVYFVYLFFVFYILINPFRQHFSYNFVCFLNEEYFGV